MRKSFPALLLAAALLVLVPLSAVAASQSADKGGRTYKWVDKDGVTHYGDSVPPEYSTSSRSELNSQGVEVNKLPAQMSSDEAARAQAAAAEESRRRQHDMFLLNTYTSTADIEQLRDERVALIDSQLQVARGSIASLEDRMKGLVTRMQGFKPYSEKPTARRMPDRLAEEVVSAMQERRTLEETVAARNKDRDELRAEFDADLARYRELTSNRLPR